MKKSSRARKAWIWSSQRLDISNAELVQLRAFQVSSILTVILYLLRSVINEFLNLFG